MTYEELVKAFSDGDKYVVYLAKRFLSPRSLEEIALSEGLPEGAYYRLFANFPEYEEKFKKAVLSEDENTKDLFLAQTSTKALQRLAEIIQDNDVKDNRDIIQACRAILGYRPVGKKMGEKTPLDSIFSDLVDGVDG